MPRLISDLSRSSPTIEEISGTFKLLRAEGGVEGRGEAGLLSKPMRLARCFSTTVMPWSRLPKMVRVVSQFRLDLVPAEAVSRLRHSNPGAFQFQRARSRARQMPHTGEAMASGMEPI